MGFLQAIKEDTLLFIILSDWVPILITIMAGGFAASVLFPWMQSSATRRSELSKKKAEISEAIAGELPRYAASWRRLIAISQLEHSRALDEQELERKNGYISDRAEARDILYSSFAMSKIYFSKPVIEIIMNFESWDETQSVKRLDELPAPEDWRNWSEKILEALHDEIRSV